MPGRLKVKVVAARGLPVMDRSTDLTDAFVEIKFGSEVLKTDVYKKSLNPQWNSEWFKFEVEDEVLQDEPLELRVLDHDTYSAHDAIGKVYIDLNPLLVKERPSVISGWFPIYDTMHGIRGDVHVIVKIELFSDFNKFRQSSCGIQFFCTPEVPTGYRLLYVHGFVEELVVNDDPEYQWIDKIRTPRSSNEARQRLFSKMAGQLIRKIGLKVLEMGGGAVIGYNQCFDLEGESGIVIRGIGTAVTLIKQREVPPSPLGMSPLKDHSRSLLVSALHLGTLPLVISTNSTPSTPARRSIYPSRSHPGPAPPLTAPLPTTTSPTHVVPSASHFAFDFPSSSPVPEDSIAPSSPPRSSTSPVKVTQAPPSGGNRRSSDSDTGTPPKGNSLGGSSGSGSGAGSGSKGFSKPFSQQINIELMEFPLFTMTSFPAGFIVHLGGVVAARSVKLLDKIHNPEEPETRDAWWMEIRTEIRSHTRAMGCHAVIGYSEQTSICDEIIVLSAVGTAARVNLAMDQYQSSVRPSPQQLLVASDKHLLTERDREQSKKLFVDVNLANQVSQKLNLKYDSSEEGSPLFNCSLCHIPYKTNSAPFPISLSACSTCRRRNVPDVLFTTINLPPEIQTLGKGAFIQARVCRPKANSKAEADAKEISDILPFLEYELHSQLMNKLKIRSMNGLFGLKMQIVVGENMLIGVATATGVCLVPLPAPPMPRILGQIPSEEENLALMDLQKRLMEQVQKNRDLYQLNGVLELSSQPSPHSVNTDDSEDEMSDLELTNGNKDTFILQVDDTKDHMIEAMLHNTLHSPGMELCNIQACPGVPHTALVCNLQMFTQVYRRKIDLDHKMKQSFTEIFEGLLRKLFFKLRRMTPCCLCDLSFNVEVPDEDEIQIVVNGVCVAVDDSQPQPSYSTESQGSSLSKLSSKGTSGGEVGASGENIEDMMFCMEEITEGSGTSSSQKPQVIKPKTDMVKRKPEHIHQGSRNYRYQHSTDLHGTEMFAKPFGGIEITPQSFVTGAKIDKYIGSYNFFFIRETTSLREVGGVCGFMQKFIAEVLAIVRAHVSSLGGNALVAYKMIECVLISNEHKNQSQCLINVCGDAVSAIKEGEITAVVPVVPVVPPDHVRKHSDSPVYVT